MRRTISLLAIIAVVFSMTAVAAAAPGGGGGNGGGGGGGGGSGTDYADLVIAYRDADGLPILIGPYVDERGTETYCVQPITTAQVPNPRFGQEGEPEFLPTLTNPVDGRTVTLVPLFAHFPEYLPVEEGDVGIMAPPDGKGPPTDHEDEGGAPCDPLVIPVGDPAYPEGFNYSQFITEVELERLNMARAPENVLVQHMIELEGLLTTTDPGLVTLDPAGRITFDGVAIDAMPKLQGMREALLETGTLPGAEGYPFPFQLVHDDFAQWSTFELTALALGGAASKFGAINPDTIAYHDRIMNIAADWVANNPTGWAPQVLTHPQTGEQFVSYRGFEYNRATTFPGYVTYIDPANWQAGYQVASYADVVSFPTLLPKLDNVAGYSQMANDAIGLILFIHEYDSVIAYADPIGVSDQEEAQRIADALNDAGDPTDPGDATTDLGDQTTDPGDQTTDPGDRITDFPGDGTRVPFTDVASDNVFYAAIRWMWESGLTVGCNSAGDRFCPTDRVTRAQMATFFVRALGLTAGGDIDRFVDDDGSVHEPNINRLAEAGITVGCNSAGDRFCPTDRVTRAQMATFFVRALGLTAGGDIDRFVDDDGSVHEANINRMAEAGITVGCNPEGDRYCPSTDLLRQQMAAFFKRSNDY